MFNVLNKHKAKTMYHWQESYQVECPTGRFVQNKNYEIHRRGYIVILQYHGSVSTKYSGKTADVFYGVHSDGVNKGEMLAFALMDGRYACSNDMGKALQKLWSGKTNKLKEIVVSGRGTSVRF